MDESVERVYETYVEDDGTIVFLRSDGSLIWKGSAGEGGGGSDQPIVTSFLRYSHSTVLSPPPNDGQIRADALAIEDVTTLWISRLDFDNRDNQFLLMQLTQGKQLYIQDLNDSDSRGIFTLTDNPHIDADEYLTFAVDCTDHTGVALAGTGILIGLMV